MIHIEDGTKSYMRGTTKELLNDFCNAANVIYNSMAQDVGPKIARGIMERTFQFALDNAGTDFTRISVPTKVD